ncbi:hypothetical protein SAMN05192550_1284 [Flavobacterium glycines]|uniref:Heparinase n=1 Tax=Flavobacterium glycines TaxID=551990 RepID=A0A1B9DRD7_9FLAO|nr:hypothetical protein [Flavobacterium glycines]OCB72243.1 hypothetical protein FBGL_06165 [Flavobacterium glycines]GEL09706.1 hypothetical protein FGL01_04450 [Flavobacterium glycines]SDI96787.1 hypothetical protein SAMN05192550_1284 [Flavobacterium glycines]
MNHISRGEFLKLGSLSLLGALVSDTVFANDGFFSAAAAKVDEGLMKKLILHNDAYVKNIFQKAVVSADVRLSNFRPVAADIAAMTASVSHPKSEFYKSEIVVERLNQAADIMLKGQYSDGTVDAGGNRQSPPDTAFVLEYLCSAAMVLKHNKQKNLDSLKEKLKKFIQNAGEAMITGGVHTPNHRWVVSAALANINSLYPDVRYTNRIDQWLAEGVYLNQDGHYSERSGIYSAVIDKALITMARLLNKPELLDKVQKNLTTTYYYTEANGDLVTVDSKRQDQFMDITVTKFYLQYRYMAIHTGNPIFTHMVNLIEKNPDFAHYILSDSLIAFMENPELQQQIPAEVKLENDFEKFFVLSNLARIRRGKTSMTLFGGNDIPVQIVSGRSSNPNFLMYRKGDAILKYLRLSSSFFRMGYFSSEGIEKTGNKYILKETKEADYYQPLAPEFRKADGDYQLSESKDRRFWNKMDFENRTASNVKKQTTVIEIEENNGALNLDFKVDGPPNIEITIELCFKEGTEIAGATLGEKGNYFLKSGFAKASMGTDSIALGPGLVEHQNVNNLDSEEYTYHQGTLHTDGVHVYITGFTPFHHKMTIS